MAGLILVEKKVSRREIARGTDRNDLALIAQCEFLHRNVIHKLVNDGHCQIDAETVLVIEEERGNDGIGLSHDHAGC